MPITSCAGRGARTREKGKRSRRFLGPLSAVGKRELERRDTPWLIDFRVDYSGYGQKEE